MFKLLLRFLRVSLLGLIATQAIAKETDKTAFDFHFKAIDGSVYPLSQFQGKVLVIINTATGCGFAPQFEGMQKLWEEYKDKDVVVISVPSNDFNDQEPLSGEEIVKYCQTKYRATFPIVGKTHVRNYASAHQLFRWLADTYGEEALPSWNFSKYVFDRNGKLVDSFSSITGPESGKVKAAIEKGLAVTVNAEKPEKSE